MKIQALSSLSVRTLSPLLLAVASSQVLATDAVEVEEVLVTGQKIQRSLQDTPESVAVVSAVDIVEQNILNIKDVIDRTANLTTQEGNRFTIRGIDSLNVSGAGLADLATIYVDGSPLPRDATLAGPLDVWDLEQIEIFRGPQSTLQGRNALAGAIIMNTAQPSYEWSGRARAVFSNEDNERRLAGAIGGPLIDDQLAFRLSAETTEADGFVENVTAGGNEDETSSTMVRAKLLIEPDSIDNLSATLSYTYDDREFGDTLASLAVNDPAENRTSFANRRSRDNVELEIGVLTVDYEISDALSLTSISAINKTRRDFISDGDRTARDIEFSVFDSETDTFTQELRLQVEKENYSLVVGGYYANVDTPNSVSDATLNIDPILDLDLVSVLVGGFGIDVPTALFIGSFYQQPVPIRAQSNNPIEIESYALFADFTYNLSDRLTLLGGLRFDNEKQTITTGNSVTADQSALPNPLFAPPTLAPVLFQINQFLVSQAERATRETETLRSPTFDALLPKLGLSWDLNDDSTVSFIVQRGYRSGGVGINLARAQTFEFDQEFIWNYELSYRSRWLEDRLTLNANAFYIDWTDQQVNVQLSGNVFDRETQNAGSSRLFGFEIESKYVANDNWEWYGSIGFADSEFEDFSATVNGQTLALSGNDFAFSPKLTLAAGVTWRSDKGWLANVNANYNSAAFPRADRVQTTREIDSRTLVNFRAGWENDNYGIYLTGENLLDEEYVQSLTPFDPLLPANTIEFARFGAPRTFAIQLEARY
ncbi:MAG: TonB-dependent receptor [Pseudomonadota bacterium]